MSLNNMDGVLLKRALANAAKLLEINKEEVNSLNVFPVPDGDTGTNMLLTVKSAMKQGLSVDENNASKIALAASQGSLMGARGNSGVILSQLFRGFANGLKGKETIDICTLAQALKQAADTAYKAVMKPTEGTILTVARVACEKAESMADEADEIVLWEAVVAAAQEALDHTPEQLPVLKKAGVVDAGGQGLVYIFGGFLSVLKDGVVIESVDTVKTVPTNSFAAKGVYAKDLDPNIVNGYCTEFIINKNETASAEKLRAYLEIIGDSVVVVEDEDIIKSHVHTSDPGKALTEAVKHGYMTNLKIENMLEQMSELSEKGKGLEKQAEDAGSDEEFKYIAVDADMPFGFVSIAAGKGIESVFTDLGANAIVTGGQTMNPSTDDILRAIHSVGAKTVFVLPNNKNIIMAAEQAAKLADREVVVLPTRTIPQGITSMLSFDPSLSAKENTINMNMAAQNVQTGSVTFAARNSDFEGHKIKKGEILAMENSKLSFTEKSVEKAAVKLARQMIKKDSNFVTIIFGEGITQEEADKVCEGIKAKAPKNVEVSALEGNQPVYYYIISVE